MGKELTEQQCNARSNEKKEGIPAIVSGFGYLPLFPSGFCIGARISKESKETYIIITFREKTSEYQITLGTYILPKHMAKALLDTLKKVLEETEKEAQNK